MRPLIEAVERVVDTSAEHAPEEGTLIERIEANLAAQRTLEAALLEHLSRDGQVALLRALAEMLGDPFEQELTAAFLESIES